MVPVVVKKYVKALLQSAEKSSVESYYKELVAIRDAYSIDKMKNILFYPEISKGDKFSFLLSLVENSDNQFKNFIHLLVENDRLDLIPSICDELRYQLSLLDNRYEGKIISNEEISDEYKKELEERLSSRFNGVITLNSVKSDYQGLKIEIEDLGVEVSFSIDRLKAQMTEHILKAI